MNPLRFILLLLSIAAFPCLAQNQIRPNLILLLTDDHRFDALGCAGNPIIQTPTIDKLAHEGTRFTNAFVTTSICATSRASIFTGQYARRHGINDFVTPFTPAQLSQIYPVLLRKAGYRTGFIGKFGVGDKDPLPDKEFDYFKGFPGQGKYWNPGPDGKMIHLTDVMTQQALEFLQGAKPDQPFCLQISYKAPHAQDANPKQYLFPPRLKDLYKDATIPVPVTATEAAFAQQPDYIQKSESRRRWTLRFTTPESYQEMIKGYFRLITQVDQSVRDIVAALQKASLDQNTVIILIGDNGYFYGEHGLADKWFPYEEALRVPLIIRDPRVDRAQRGITRDQMVLNIDIAPTLLALANVPIPGSMQGQDLTPLTRGQPAPNWRQEFFYEHLYPHKDIPKSEGVRTARYMYWKYLDVDHDAEWLFDLNADPYEMRNLAAQTNNATVLAELREKTVRFRDSLK
jgi:arylsulfatase A-like enzyme